MHRLKRHTVLVLKLLLAAGIVAILARYGLLEVQRVGQAAMDGIHFVAIGALVFLFNIFVTAWRWRLLVLAQNVPMSYGLALRLTFVGLFFSTFMPGATGGDLVKAYYVWRYSRKATAAVTTVFLDRVIGLYCMCGMGALFALFHWETFWQEASSRALLVWAPALFLSATAFFALMYTRPVRRVLTDMRGGPPIPFGDIIHKVYLALDMYRGAKGVIAYSLVLSVLTNTVGCIGFWAYGMALGEDAMRFHHYLVAFPLGMVVNGIPILPMGIGQGEAALAFLYHAVSGSLKGAEASILFHIVVLFWGIVGSAFYLTIRKETLAAGADAVFEGEDAVPGDEPERRKRPGMDYGGRRLVDYAGALHLRTHYSDGSESMPAILRQARQSHLDFLVVTDGGTLRAATEGWERWHDGVLTIVGAEVPLGAGQAIVLGMKSGTALPGPADPAGWDALRREGGMVIATGCRMPGSAAAEGWHWWECEGIDGVEVWSYMEDWSQGIAGSSMLRRVLNPAGRIRGPAPEDLARWDEQAQARRIVAVGGLNNDARNFPFRRCPIYLFKILPFRFTFQTVRTHLLCEELTGDAGKDVPALLRAMKEGHGYVAYDYLASATGFRFEAASGERPLIFGDEARMSGPQEFRVESPYAASLRLLRNGETIAEAEGTSLVTRVDRPGAYRVEARIQGKPWVFTNPIYLRSGAM